MKDAVLFVGVRRGALAAAARLGLEALVVDVGGGRGAAPAGTVSCAPDAGDDAVPEAARRLAAERGARVRAVVALTEKAVLPAAYAREALDLGGMRVATALCFTDKRVMKRAAEDAGIPVTPWRDLGPADDARSLARELGLPLVLKLARSSGSRGQIVARTLEQVEAALPAAALAERVVVGRELSVETFVAGGELLFENPTEYLVPLHASLVASPPDPESWKVARGLSRRVLSAFGLERGMAHLELFLTSKGPLLGEVAARPPGGRLMPLLRRAYGFDPWEALIEIELGRRPDLPAPPRRCAGAYVLHPGPGRVRALSGLEDARAVPGITRVRVRLEPGQRVPPRLSSGQDVGFLQAEGADRDAVAGALLEAHRRLRIDIER